MKLFLTLAIAALLCGCNTPLLTTVYRTSAATHVSARTALTAWNDYLGTHRVSATQEREVKGAWEKYQAAQIALLDVTAVYAAATNPSATDQEKLELATAEASRSLADLVALIRKFGVKV